MSLEELSAYLHEKFPRYPDEVQQVLIDFLAAREPIRFPKTWAFRRVQWRKIDAQRKEAYRKVLNMTKVYDPVSVPVSDNPLLRAQRRETIERFVQGLTGGPQGGVSRWKRWGYKEDLQELLDPKPIETHSY